MADATLHPGQNSRIIREGTDVYPREQLDFEPGFWNTIVVHNLPVVPKEKFEKLAGVIRKIYSRIGAIKDLRMPVDPTMQETSGFCFVQFNAPQEAKLAKEITNGYKLDRKHIFSVTMYRDFVEHAEAPELSVPPIIPPHVPQGMVSVENLSAENLQQWLTDEKARGQFVVRAGSDTEVFWNDAKQLKPEPVYKHAYWTESFVQWSPLGTYLATVHRQGVAVWGGASSFNRLMRYHHPQVKLIDFSPGEKYLVTYSSDEPSINANTSVINIFDVRTGKVMRNFKGSADKFPIGETGGVTGACGPIISDGKEDKYFAIIGKDTISVYETETFSLVDEKSLQVENVADFSWSPTDPILALFIPEQAGGSQPARVSLVKIPSKEEVKKKSLFSVSDYKMYWQSNGDYLAVKVDLYTQSKRTTYTEVELLRIKEENIPIEVLELENKEDKIIAFAWEPKGHKFAVIHGDSLRPDVSFYSMRTAHDTGRVSKLITLKGKKANALFWSPGGRNIILAGLEGFKGRLEFFDVDFLKTMAMSGHYKATDVEWDPTGRYVATSAQHEMENGFIVWSYYGKQLYKIRKDRLLQFMWRPRPPCWWSRENIANYLNMCSRRYEARDLDLSDKDREKRRMKDEWGSWVDAWKMVLEEEDIYGEASIYGKSSDEEEEEVTMDGGPSDEEEEEATVDGEPSDEEDEELSVDGEASDEEEEVCVSVEVLSFGFGRE